MRAKEKIWEYMEHSGLWRLIDSRGESVLFKLTAGRQTTFEGFLLPEHVEGDEHQLLNIMQDATYLHLYILGGSRNAKWSNMFSQAIQTSENPAPFLQELICMNFDGKLETLISRLQYFQDLRHLRLSVNITLNHFDLAHAMESGQLQVLETLDLRRTKLDDAGCEVYASALQSGRVEGLSQIDFAENEISDSGAAALARSFQSGHVKNLQQIYLSNNKIMDKGMDALGSAFASGHMQKLAVVDLGDNGIGDEGMVHLTTGLETGKLPNLCVLRLDGNKVGVKGIKGLAKALESGNLCSLKRLYFGICNLNDQEFEPLVQALSNNTSLIVDITTQSDPVNGRLTRQRELNVLHSKLQSAATTLRRTLERSIFRSLFTRETKEHEE